MVVHCEFIKHLIIKITPQNTMRTKAKLLTLVFTVLLSCTKETADASKNSTALVGQWSWTRSSGGFTGSTITPASTGVKKRIEFTSDSIYKEYHNDTLKIICRFYILKAKSIFNQNTTNIISYGDYGVKQSFSISQDTLILNDEVYDGYGHVYKRIK